MILRAAKEIGALIRDRRSQLNLSQQELARKVGVSRAWLVALEKGKPSVQLGLVLQTLNELGLSIHAGSDVNDRPSGGIDLDTLVDAGSLRKKP